MNRFTKRKETSAMKKIKDAMEYLWCFASFGDSIAGMLMCIVENFNNLVTSSVVEKKNVYK